MTVEYPLTNYFVIAFLLPRGSSQIILCSFLFIQHVPQGLSHQAHSEGLRRWQVFGCPELQYGAEPHLESSKLAISLSIFFLNIKIAQITIESG